MNVYRVTVDSEKTDKYCDVWTIEAMRPSSAIRKVLNRTGHNSAKNVSVECELIAKSTTYVEYKRR